MRERGKEMKVIIKGRPKEIAALALAVQGRQKISSERRHQENEREQLIRAYECRLEKLKAGASPGDVIL